MSSPEAVEKPMTALLAEDDPSLRPYISVILQQRGFLVLAACNAEEALTIFHEFPGTIDLLITDVHMGKGPDGVGLAEHLLSLQSNLPVLVISGTPEGEKLATEHGLAFLAKPFTLAKFTSRVRELLASARTPEKGTTASEQGG
jgi:two-component system, sensor histidine kinase